MSYLVKGLILFVANIVLLMLAPKLFPNANSAPLWYSITLIIIALLYAYFGSKTASVEKKKIVGILYFLLAFLTLFFLIMINAKY